jgi:hypothetical protein
MITPIRVLHEHILLQSTIEGPVACIEGVTDCWVYHHYCWVKITISFDIGGSREGAEQGARSKTYYTSDHEHVSKIRSLASWGVGSRLDLR